MNANCIFWFRRDLSLDDNIGLFHALKENERVLPIFIFDKNILNNLKPDDKRMPLIYDLIKKLKKELINLNSNIEIIHDTPENYFQNLPKSVKRIYTNHDYEPYATERDNKIKEILHDKDIDFITFKNQVIFEKGEIVKDDGDHYSVFTPYMNKWKSKFSPSLCKPVNVKEFKKNLHSFHRVNLIMIPWGLKAIRNSQRWKSIKTSWKPMIKPETIQLNKEQQN